MTTYVLATHVDRAIHPEWSGSADSRCAFCRIVAKQSRAYVVYEDEDVIAFLDLMPIRPGHTLLIPKLHCPRIADLPPKIGGSIGMALPKIISAINKGTGNPDLNIVLNQGYAQAVHHAHFHLIPAPMSPKPPPSALPSVDALALSSNITGAGPISSSGSSSPTATPKPSHSNHQNGSSKHKKNRSNGSNGSRRVSDDRSSAELIANPPTHEEMLMGEELYRDGRLGDRAGREMAERIRSAL